MLSRVLLRASATLALMLCSVPLLAAAEPCKFEWCKEQDDPDPPPDRPRFGDEATCASRSLMRWIAPQPDRLEVVRCPALGALKVLPKGESALLVEEHLVQDADFNVSHHLPDRRSRVIRLFDVSREGRALYVLGDRFSYCEDRTGRIISVPPGFVTDFASIPGPVRGLLPPDGPYARAAILHDFLYAVGAPGERKAADDVLMAAMVEYKVPAATREIIYTAVRLGGGAGYGLKSDWAFVSPNTLQPRPGPPKPKTGYYDRLDVSCRNFRSWEASIDSNIKDGLSDYVRQINDEELRMVQARRGGG